MVKNQMQNRRIGSRLQEQTDRLEVLCANRLVIFVSFLLFPVHGFPSFLRTSFAITIRRNCTRRDGCGQSRFAAITQTKLRICPRRPKNFSFLSVAANEISCFLTFCNFISCVEENCISLSNMFFFFSNGGFIFVVRRLEREFRFAPETVLNLILFLFFFPVNGYKNYRYRRSAFHLKISLAT